MENSKFSSVIPNGVPHKVLLLQSIISLRENGEFILQNEGKRAIFVDGKPVMAGDSCRLLNNSVLEIAALRFVFLINALLVNQRAINRIKTEVEPVTEDASES